MSYNYEFDFPSGTEMEPLPKSALVDKENDKIYHLSLFDLRSFKEGDGIIDIDFSAHDPYWVMYPYYPNNSFVVPCEHIFYPYLIELFKGIEKNDNPYNRTLKDNLFTWYSEGHGELDEANTLSIKKEEDVFNISFYNNPKNFFYNQYKCFIRFDLSGSRNVKISGLLARMLNEIKYGIV
ncbi:MAG: hypothetical protein ACOX6Q_02720 [Candidatus Dojkabacteria bacterium]